MGGAIIMCIAEDELPCGLMCLNTNKFIKSCGFMCLNTKEKYKKVFK